MPRITGLMVLFLLLVVLASNGYCVGSGAYRLELPDAAASAMGSAFVAQADNPSAVYYNPAGLTQLKGNSYISLGVGVVQPFISHESSDGQEETKARNLVFGIPHGYVVTDFGLEKFVFGIGETSFWGLGTEWATDSFSKYAATKSTLSTQDVMFAGAYKINNNLSIGLSADLVRAQIDKRKKMKQTGGADADFRLTGVDNNSWGYRVSTLYTLNERHSFGLMYRSPVNVEYKGHAYLDNMNNATYLALFGSSTFETDLVSNTRLPQSAVFGYCFKPNDKWKFEADAEWMDWHSVREDMIYYPAIAQGDARRNILDSGNPNPRDWHQSMSYALGTEYKVNDKWKLRAGYFYHQTPIPQGTFDTALPDSTSNSGTLGVGYNFNKNTTFDLAYGAMFFRKRDIDNNVGGISGADIRGEYSQFTNFYFATVTFKI